MNSRYDLENVVVVYNAMLKVNALQIRECKEFRNGSLKSLKIVRRKSIGSIPLLFTTYIIALLLVGVVFQSSMRAAALMLHDRLKRTLSSKKNAMHERERIRKVQWGSLGGIFAGKEVGLAYAFSREPMTALSRIGCEKARWRCGAGTSR